ncbi:unnamed protein product, partial [Gulo gulo]
MPGRDVKHQGASEPSGFRQKFSRRSLGMCFLSALGGASPPASQPRAGAPPPSARPRAPAFLQAPPRDPTPDVPAAKVRPPAAARHLTCKRISLEQNDADVGSARPTSGKARPRRWCWPCPGSPRP